MADQYRRAVLAFPDEDVLIGTKFIDPAGYQAFKGLEDVVPRPDHKAIGRGAGVGPAAGQALRRREPHRRPHLHRHRRRQRVRLLDHESLKPEAIDPEVATFFKPLDRDRGDYLIAFGWAMAEDLAAGSVGK